MHHDHVHFAVLPGIINNNREYSVLNVKFTLQLIYTTITDFRIIRHKYSRLLNTCNLGVYETVVGNEL